MESPQPVVDAPAPRNRTPYTIALVALILCCCCTVLIAAGYYYYRQNILTVPVEPTEEATPAAPPTDPSSSNSAPFADVGVAPEGGLGNDILRNDTWALVAASAQGLGCNQPIGAVTTVEVLQEPQDGIWVEKWTVACEGGESYAYEIQFTLDATGTTFDIKPLD